jgi:hypothetical protein
VGEVGNLFVTGVVHGNADNLQALRSIFLLQVNQPRHFYLARAAPGGPEIQQYSLAAEPSQRRGFAIGNAL